MSNAIVSLEGVRKSYGSGAAEQQVLAGLSLAIDEGEFAVVLGPSGCGKTTLLNLIGGLDVADAGRVEACGVELTGASRAQLTAYRAGAVGFIFQFYNLLPTLTSVENVEAGVRVAGIGREEARRRARGPARAGRSRRPRRALPLPALRWRAAARCDRPRARQAARGSCSRTSRPATSTRKRVAASSALMRELNEETGVTFVAVSHNPAMASAGRRIVRLSHGVVEDAGATGGRHTMMLLRKALRDLRAMGSRAVLMIVVIGAGAGTAAGISLALNDVKQTRNDFYARYALADLDVRLRQPIAPAALLARARAAGATRRLDPSDRLGPGTARLRGEGRPPS